VLVVEALVLPFAKSGKQIRQTKYDDFCYGTKPDKEFFSQVRGLAQAVGQLYMGSGMLGCHASAVWFS
jgi:hypothetical protein